MSLSLSALSIALSFLAVFMLTVPAVAMSQVARATAPSAAAPAQVTIYRCTDSQERLILRDSPCEKGQRQETRSMLRPKDAPARPPPIAATSAGIVSAPVIAPPQIIVINTPQPLYECVTPDNNRYLSDSAEGNPRWVPLWALGAPVLASVPVIGPGGVSVSVNNGHVSGSYSSGSFGSVIVPTAAGYGAGTWVRDACSALPQNDVCARLQDRRDAVRRRFFNAQASERSELNREERSLNARLAQDCR